MDNLKWLKTTKSCDKSNGYSFNLEYRTVKALEIIAEELCLLNKTKTLYVTENSEITSVGRQIEIAVAKDIKKGGGE